jgi:(2Fe-2S) ferredoxin
MGIPQPAFYIFKCEQSSPPGMPKPSCVNEQTRELYQYMSNKLMVLGVTTTVHPIRTACLNRCQMGPVMLIEPGHHMYIGLTKEKIDKIIDEHIIKGNPVKEYIIPDEYWDEAISPLKMMEMAQG